VRQRPSPCPSREYRLEMSALSSPRCQRSLGFGVALGVAVLLLGPVGAASATTFNVNTTTDGNHGSCGTTPGSCSLRDAIIAANAGSGGDTINVPPGTYDLTLTGAGEDMAATGDLDITKSVTVAGAGAGSGGTTVKGEGDRVFDIFSGAAAVTISGMAITNGAENFGGAIRTVGSSLTLTGDSFTQNTATSVGFGGAIFAEPSGGGTLMITNCTFSSNMAADATTMSGGFGGAVMFEPGGTGTLTISNSTFDSNTAQSGTTSGGGFGGALMFEPGGTGTLTITGSTFSSNTSAGSTTQGGFGGAFMFEPGADPSSLSVTNSTFTANQAGGHHGFGGGIIFEPSGATSSGTLTHITVVGNSTTGADSGGGILVEAAPLMIRNSIISGNTAAGVASNCSANDAGTLVTAGHGVELGASCGFDLNADPKVAALADNGGPTKTMALTAGSPAIDAADDAFCPATDQRGVARPQDGGTGRGAICDIGAFELVATITPTSTTTTSTPTTTTTTLPAGSCGSEPATATFASIDCRLDALLTDLNAAPGLGAFGPKLVKNVQTAKARKLAAEGSCRASNAKKVKKQLQQSAKALTQYAHRLNGLSARKKIASLRQRFLDEAAPIQSDLKTLRGSVRCPGDAPAG
jgi:CSLREA domain-containing protein